MDEDDAVSATPFAGWLQASMHNRGLTQAQLARSVGVADTQVSRWRRGQVVPTVPYLQRLADTFGIDRVTLDQLVGLPIAQAGAPGDRGLDPRLEAELQAHQARLRQVMQHRLQPHLWRAYIDACVALAEGLAAANEPSAKRPLGFGQRQP
jgi:transcriptional regulator with XRE-family HTH domain